MNNRKSSCFVIWFYLILSFPLVFSSEIEIPSSSQEVQLKPFSTCFGFRVSCPDLDLNSFCFPSTQSNFINLAVLPQAGKTKSGQSLSFALSNGGSVTCSSVEPKNGAHETGFGKDDRISCKAPLIPDNWIKASNGIISDLDEVSKHGEKGQTGQFSDSSFSLNVEINPPVLDWGSNTLYSASFLTLNVKNLNNESVLQLYEPYSSDPQFYAYEFQSILLKPGKNISLSFVFLPRILGSNLAQIVIQTSFGGFVLQAKGLAIESPYKVEPLIGIELHKSGVLSKNLSIYNPFDDIIYVEELAVWISASESVNGSNHAICKLDAIKKTSYSNEWFNLANSGFEFVKMDLKPGKKWEVSPKIYGTIVELKLQGKIEGKVFGAICMKLINSTTRKVSTIVVPLELEVHVYPTDDNSLNGFGSISLSFDRHLACAGTGSGTIFSLYLRNEGLNLLTVLNIFEEREGEKLFEIRYVKKLVIFPGADTIIGLISLQNGFSEISYVELLQCNLVVETNYSLSPLVKIPCQDFIRASELGFEKDKGEVLNVKKESLGAVLQDPTENKISVLGEIEASNLIISNWVSHATKPEYFVLTNQESLFPPVQIGSQMSKFIPVKNTSPYPVAVQLILSSEELISDCRSSDVQTDRTFPSSSPKISAIKTRFGFSIPDSGLTEALLNPFESVLLGPITFHPSKRCNWSSSALIRSNLSGVEWVFLHASGGSHAISLLEGSEYVWKLEFDPDSNFEKNSSLSSLETLCPSCDYKFFKDIYAKNTGELPLEIKRVRVSGTDCSLDGFTVTRNCKGFSLKPDESVRISVSYQPEFSASTVQRDLELAMASGIFVIPMRVNVPACMLSQCRKASVFWRVSLFVFLGIVVFLAVLFFVRINIIPVSLTVGSRDCYSRLDGDDDDDSNNNNNNNNNNKNNKNSSSNNNNNNNNGRGQSEKRPLFHHGNKGSRAVQREQQKHERPINTNYSVCQNSPKWVDPNPPNKPTTPMTSPLKPTKDPASLESPQTDLTIKVVREKSKRRNKRRSHNSSVASKLEASSSHSSNSTPSSPLSNGSTPKQSWPVSPDMELTRNPFTLTPTKKEKVEKEVTNEPSEKAKIEKSIPVVSPVFSGLNGNNNNNSPFFSRAPGPKVHKEKSASANREEKEGVFAKEFTYDIWADHFSGRWVYAEGRDGNYSKSFFAIQPLAPRGVMSGNGNGNGANDDVTGVHGMN